LTAESVPVTTNDPVLTRRLAGAFVRWFGADRVKPQLPTTGGEDFSEFGRTPEWVPICMWWVGATDPVRIEVGERTGVPAPSNHSATFAPLPEPTLKTCVTSMTAAALELMGRSQATPPQP
jgi:hippurate hydrolase